LPYNHIQMQAHSIQVSSWKLKLVKPGLSSTQCHLIFR